jgi:hypothetical protein
MSADGPDRHHAEIPGVIGAQQQAARWEAWSGVLDAVRRALVVPNLADEDREYLRRMAGPAARLSGREQETR